ncbi:MAG: hypothetical protein LUD48_06240, partial [Prevotella sp.]|nr:hypothetical protein [Prevotella sp.]
MEKYHYMSHMVEDIKDYVDNDFQFSDLSDCCNSFENFKQRLSEKLEETILLDDCGVTGLYDDIHYNDKWSAKDCVLDNTDLMHDAVAAGYATEDNMAHKFYSGDYKYIDTAIRECLLPRAIDKYIDSNEEELMGEYDVFCDVTYWDINNYLENYLIDNDDVYSHCRTDNGFDDFKKDLSEALQDLIISKDDKEIYSDVRIVPVSGDIIKNAVDGYIKDNEEELKVEYNERSEVK